MFKTSNKYRFPAVFLLLLIFCCLYQCSDIIEEDISDEEIHLVLPADSQTVSTSTPQFKWQEVDGVIEYRIQIARPDFENPLEYVTDSTVNETTLYLSLNPGTYQWRVRGENASSMTPYKTRTVFIDSTGGISNSQVILTAPTNGAIFSDSIVEFDWQPLISADSYTLRLFENENGVVGDQLNSTISVGATDTSLYIPEGNWFWRVQGISGSSTSQFSQRAITIDQSPPSLPFLTFPIEDTLSITGSTTFEWGSGIDEFSSTNDSIFIYDDVDMANLILAEDGINNIFELPNNELGTGRFFWTIRTTDAVGNFSESAAVSFDIAP